MMPTNQSLEEQFLAACDAYLNFNDAKFLGYWLRPECPFLSYPRDCNLSLSEGASSKLDAISALTPEEHEARAPQLIPGLRENAAQKRFACQVQGLIAAVRAAQALAGWNRDPLPAAFIFWATESLGAFQKAWPIHAAVHLSPGSPYAARQLGDDLPPSTAALHALTVQKHVDPKQIPVSTWLTVRRLLAYLLKEEEFAFPTNNRGRGASDPFQVETTVLYAAKTKPGEYEDLPRPLVVRSAVEGYFGCYLDPVALGLTQVDDSLLKSIELAWERASPEVQHRLAHYESFPALRIAPDTTKVSQVEGGSAGALFVCALFGAATRTELNSDATASISLRKSPSATEKGLAGIALAPVSLAPVSKDSIDAKLKAAAKCGLRRVLLHPDQKDGNKAIVPPPGLNVDYVSNLAETFEKLTGNARMERVLALYSDSVLAKWETAWTTENNEKLLYYVPPKYRLLNPAANKRGAELFIALTSAAARTQAEPIDPQEPHEDLAFETEEQTLAELLRRGGDRLCVSEVPGAGKSIFTRRLQAFLCSQAGRDAFCKGKPLLAVRWEEIGRIKLWPDNFESALADAIIDAKESVGIEETCQDVVKWALGNERVVIILDALDQTSTKGVQSLGTFLTRLKEENWSCRVVLTGRPFAVEDGQRDLFKEGSWRFGAILPLDAAQQYRYLFGPEPLEGAADAWQARNLRGANIVRLVDKVADQDFAGSLRARFPQYDQIAELFGNPQTLWMIRSLTEKGHRLESFNRTGLYLQTSHFMLQEAAQKLNADGDLRVVTENDRKRWQELLAAAAFAMMAHNPTHFRVAGQANVDTVKRQAAARMQPAPTDQEWQLVDRIGDLTNRTLLDASSQLVWAWPNRRMMEFYCGLHLARNTQPGWVQDMVGAPLRCGDETLRRHAGDLQWAEAFRFAIEMPREVRDDRVLAASLAELYQRDAGVPTENRRPTQLMYEAWSLLENELPGGKQLLSDYRQQFRQLVAAKDPVALQLVRDEELVDLDSAERHGGRSLQDSNRRQNFVCCPPGENPSAADRTFLMGSPDDEENAHDAERPRHKVQLTPFLLQATPVTREQFGRFDPQYQAVERESLESYAKEFRCPAIEISFYDAWCFARWIGGELPTEAQWEFACRAGSQKRYCRIKVDVDLDTEDELRQVAHFNSEEGTVPVGSKWPNLWGLYDMHGNVWEWCWDWYDSAYYASRPDPDKDPTGPDSGSGRVLRGGGWDYYPRSSRSANRFRFSPDLRSLSFGFRVAFPRTL